MKKEDKPATVKKGKKKVASASECAQVSEAIEVASDNSIPAEVVPMPCACPQAEVTTKVVVTGEKSPVLTMFEDIPGAVERSMEAISKLPRISCNSCNIGPECPKYKTGHVCAYEEAFNAFPSRDIDSVVGLVHWVLDGNKKRLMRAMLNEQLVQGGGIDESVTRLSEVVMKQTQILISLAGQNIRAEFSVSEPGAGVLSQLFGATQK